MGSKKEIVMLKTQTKKTEKSFKTAIELHDHLLFPKIPKAIPTQKLDERRFTSQETHLSMDDLS